MKVKSIFLFVFILNLTTHLFAQNIEKNKILIIGQFDRPDERYAIEVTLTELFSKQGLIAIPSLNIFCLLYTSPSPRDRTRSRMPSSA